MRQMIVLILLPLVVAACTNTGLRDLRGTSKGPDEFIVSPNKALEQPVSYSELPTPTPGNSNITDQKPLDDRTRALGGRVEAEGGAVPARDGALVQHASRLGVTPGVREELAESDAAFRKRKGRLTQFRIVRVDRYNQAYRREAINPDDELRRWRRAGARTPTAPPSR